MSFNPKSVQFHKGKKLKSKCKKSESSALKRMRLKMIDSSYFELGQTNGGQRRRLKRVLLTESNEVTNNQVTGKKIERGKKFENPFN